MSSKRWGIAAVCLTMLTGACQKPPAFTAADEAVVKGMFDSTVVWLKAKKFNEWSMNFADNGFLQLPNAKSATGRPGLIAWANALPPLEEFSFSNVKVAGTGNMAMGTSDYALKFAGMPADTGKQLVVIHRSADGKWSIAAASFNSDLPPAPMPAAAKAPAKK